MPEISKAKVLILATNGFEQSELQVPQRKLKEAGAEVVVVSPERGQIRGWKEKDWGDSVAVDKTLDAVTPRSTTPSCCPVARSIPTCCA